MEDMTNFGHKPFYISNLPRLPRVMAPTEKTEKYFIKIG